MFVQDGTLYRQVEACYRAVFDKLIESGLYDELTRSGLLISHKAADLPAPAGALVIQPERIEMISYPYEWCFGELRDAALATLEIQKRALDKGMSLKDASAYNIQFRKGLPVCRHFVQLRIARSVHFQQALGQVHTYLLPPHIHAIEIRFRERDFNQPGLRMAHDQQWRFAGSKLAIRS